MAIDAELERWLMASFRIHLTSAAALAGIVFQFRGMNNLNTDTLEEWIHIELLTFEKTVARVSQYHGRPLFQVSCSSKFAEGRVDKNVDAPFILSGKVRKVLEENEIPVKKFGGDSSVIGSMKVNRVTLTYRQEELTGTDRQEFDIHTLVLTVDCIFIGEGF